jgi:flagellar biosynthesis protein FlhB
MSITTSRFERGEKDTEIKEGLIRETGSLVSRRDIRLMSLILLLSFAALQFMSAYKHKTCHRVVNYTDERERNQNTALVIYSIERLGLMEG